MNSLRDPPPRTHTNTLLIAAYPGTAAHLLLGDVVSSFPELGLVLTPLVCTQTTRSTLVRLDSGTR